MEKPKEIYKIQEGIVSKIWNNDVTGMFVFNDDRICYHFIETTRNGANLIEPENQQLQKQPICIGFIAFLISNIGKKEPQVIYKSYLDQVQQAFIEKKKYEPFSNRENLLNEFYECYPHQESIYLLNSNKIYSFISPDSVDLIDKYISDYENFIKKTLPKKALLNFSGFKDLRSQRFNILEDENVMKKQYFFLNEKNFIDCTEKTFLYRMGFNFEDENLNKINWIAKNKKSVEPNKRSLIDYLTIIGVNENEIKEKINSIFNIPNGSEFRPNNYDYAKGVLISKSEYNDELVKIVNISKQR
jgi:hypothetical protein